MDLRGADSDASTGVMVQSARWFLYVGDGMWVQQGAPRKNQRGDQKALLVEMVPLWSMVTSAASPWMVGLMMLRVVRELFDVRAAGTPSAS